MNFHYKLYPTMSLLITEEVSPELVIKVLQVGVEVSTENLICGLIIQDILFEVKGLRLHMLEQVTYDFNVSDVRMNDEVVRIY